MHTAGLSSHTSAASRLMNQRSEPAQVAWIGSPPGPDEDLTARTRARFAGYRVNYGPWLPPSREAAILDYGFGDGGVLTFLHELGYQNLTGVDIDRRFVEFGQDHLPAQIEHIPEPAAFLNTHEARYDLVLALQVAYYVPRDTVATWFSMLANTLRPGGRLIVAVFNASIPTSAMTVANDPFIRNAFTEHSLRWLLDVAGLEIVHLGSEVYPRGGVRRAAWLASRLILRQARRAVYLMDRGVDALNPTLFGKHLIAIADKPAVPDAK